MFWVDERYPDDLDDDAILVPVDVSLEEDFPTTCAEAIEKVGALGAVRAMVKGHEHFAARSWWT